jgi:hypothetical protein
MEAWIVLGKYVAVIDMYQPVHHVKRVKDSDCNRKSPPVILVVVITVGTEGNSTLEILPIQRPRM